MPQFALADPEHDGGRLPARRLLVAPGMGSLLPVASPGNRRAGRIRHRDEPEHLCGQSACQHDASRSSRSSNEFRYLGRLVWPIGVAIDLPPPNAEMNRWPLVLQALRRCVLARLDGVVDRFSFFAEE